MIEFVPAVNGMVGMLFFTVVYLCYYIVKYIE